MNYNTKRIVGNLDMAAKALRSKQASRIPKAAKKIAGIVKANRAAPAKGVSRAGIASGVRSGALKASKAGTSLKKAIGSVSQKGKTSFKSFKPKFK